MRIVVDTNVIVSGLKASSQPPSQVLDLWRDGKIDILASTDTVAELQRVLGYPKVRQLLSYSDDLIQAFLEEFAKEIILIDVNIEVDVVVNDPTDNVFLSLAIAGDAEYVVTGDKKHLLPLEQYEDIPIITPATFMAMYD